MAAQTMAEYISQVEMQDGIRFTWNHFPGNKVEAGQCVVPLACLYTPLKDRSDLPAIKYEPVMCMNQSCRAILNPYCQLDLRSRTWICCLCKTRNQFPPQYAGMTEQSLAAEVMPQFTTLEYTIGRSPVLPPIFLYVMDTCLEETDFVELKCSLIKSLKLLPPHSLVGLLTFGRMVHVHELESTAIAKSFVFNGTKDYNGQQVQNFLGMTQRSSGFPTSMPAQSMGMPNQTQMPQPQQGAANQIPHNKFIRPVEQVEPLVTQLLSDLPQDPWPVPQGTRPLRSVGAAMSIAVGLLEASFPNTGARIMLFQGGPCTQGPGMVIDEDLKHIIRSHQDIEKDNASFMRKAIRHYEALANRAAQNSHVVDIYSCSLDQTGLHEEKYLPNYTGGHMVLGDSFASTLFLQTFERAFTKNSSTGAVQMAFAGQMECKTSKELKVSGCIGCCFSANKKTSSTGDTEIGVGRTSVWRLNGINPWSTYAVFLQPGELPDQLLGGEVGFVQFVTQYQTAAGERKIRVTTTCRSCVNPAQNRPLFVSGFDQEAAAVVMARWAMYRAETTESLDVLRWMDRQLIRLCKKFGEYSKDQPSTFQLPYGFTFFPQFMFHMRRSQFLQVFNNSPDETAYYRHTLNDHDCGNSLLMLQPSLTSFNLQGEAVPALLDATSINKETVLLMDSFFQLLIYHGQNIAMWKAHGYLEMPEYQYLKVVLEKPQLEAQEILRSRFPLPRYIETEEGGSQARFLLTKVNPSLTHNNMYAGYGGESGNAVITDDVSLEGFMEHLKKLAVASST